MEMFRFENPDYFYSLLVIPVLVLLYVFSIASRNTRLRKFSDSHLLTGLFKDVPYYKGIFKLIIYCLIICALTLTLANPQLGSKLEEVKREGIELIVAIDVSNSMNAEDVKPSRLERTKKAVSVLIDNLYEDRLGLIIFAGDAFLQLPLTTDYSAAKLMLTTISTDLIEIQGTAIGAAIKLAENSFSEDEKRKKAIIIITDGENHEDNALSIAEEAANKGIKIYTIGMGSVNGAPIPIYSGGRETGYLKDKSGTTVISKLNADMLNTIASTGGGKFVHSVNSDPDLTAILEDLSELEKTEFGTKIVSDYEDRFQYPLIAALLLILFDLSISESRNKLLAMLNMFAEGRK